MQTGDQLELVMSGDFVGMAVVCQVLGLGVVPFLLVVVGPLRQRVPFVTMANICQQHRLKLGFVSLRATTPWGT